MESDSTVRARNSTLKRFINLSGLVLLLLSLWLLSKHVISESSFSTYDLVTQAHGNFAYALFFSKYSSVAAGAQDENEDSDFAQIRQLLFQLLHDPATRTIGYPVVVCVTEDVSSTQRQRLASDGATVIVVKAPAASWVHSKTTPAWDCMLAKLNLFNLVQYDRIAFFASDTVLTRSVDGIFDDPAAQVFANRGVAKNAPVAEGVQPAFYVFAANSGAATVDHPYPPPKGKSLVAGCVVFQPHVELFEYYLRIANTTDRFPLRNLEQGVWSYAHRRDGNLPWKQLHYDWNVDWASSQDLRHGIASLKLGTEDTREDLPLRDFVLSIQSKMESFWAAIDGEL